MNRETNEVRTCAFCDEHAVGSNRYDVPACWKHAEEVA